MEELHNLLLQSIDERKKREEEEIALIKETLIQRIKTAVSAGKHQICCGVDSFHPRFSCFSVDTACNQLVDAEPLLKYNGIISTISW